MQLLQYAVSILTAKQYYPYGVEKHLNNLLKMFKNSLVATWVIHKFNAVCGTSLLDVFLNADVLVRFDILACADSTAGPLHLDGFDNSIIVHAKDGCEFTL